jgi:OFA family oxalate/formate antiporter-like MFS transporter
MAIARRVDTFARSEAGAARWWQLLIGIVCMAMIANMQYGWTLFVPPIDEKYHWGKASIQVAFTIFVVLETWLVPVEGYLVDKFGPRLISLIGGVLCGLAWTMNSFASSLAMLYAAAAVGGIGAGAVYGTCVGNALKWFPDRRGLAAGLTAMGFGAGSALTIIPIANMIKSAGYEQTFLYFGVGQGIVVVLLSLFLAAPPPGFREHVMGYLAAGLKSTRHQYTPREMLRTPVFYVMYLMFVLMAAGGLMATAQLAVIAKDFGVAETPVSVLGLTLPALTFALSMDRILNGLTRPFFGWVSDQIGRENTMFIAFTLEGVAILLLSAYGQDPVLFVLLSAFVFFAWGEIYSLFPATSADSYGETYATTNAGLLYTAKGTAALLVPFSSILSEGGVWHTVFYLASGMAILAGVLALVALKPMRQREIARSEGMAGAHEALETN